MRFVKTVPPGSPISALCSRPPIIPLPNCAAHTLKGTAANLGAMQLASLAKVAEKGAAESDSQMACAALEAMGGSLNQALQELDRLVGEAVATEIPAVAGASSPPPSEVRCGGGEDAPAPKRRGRCARDCDQGSIALRSVSRLIFANSGAFLRPCHAAFDRCLSPRAALLLLACCTGCPEPTQPVAKPVTQPTNGPEPDVKPAEKTEEKAEPDDAAIVKELEDGYHKLKKDDQGRVIEVNLDKLGDVERTNAALELVAKLPNVVRLAATGPDVKNSGLEKIKGMKKLKVLDLDQASVDDAGMEHLVGLPLVDINLKLTNVRDDGVAHLARFPRSSNSS